MCGKINNTIKDYGIPDQVSDDSVELHWEWLDFGVSNKVGEQHGYYINVYVNSEIDGRPLVREEGSPAEDTLPNTYEIGNSVFDGFEVGTIYTYIVEFYNPEDNDPFCIVEGAFTR